MRKRGFEPPRGCPRQPLKLVRLPFRHFRVRGSSRTNERTYFGCCVPVGPVGGVAGGGVVVPVAAVAPVGAVAPGTAGAVIGAFGAGGACVPLTTELEPPRPMIDSAIAPSMKSTERMAVAFESTVAPVRAPNADWLLPPPKAAAMS